MTATQLGEMPEASIGNGSSSMSSRYRPGQPPLISAVMSVFDPDPRYFRKAIQSLLAQRFADWELIIVEDPSPRSAAKTLDEFRDSRIRHIVNPRRTSLVAQRNRSLAEARGEYVALMDADDIACPYRFVKQVQFLERHADVDVVGSNVSVIDREDRVVGYRWFPSLHDEIYRAMMVVVPLCQPSVMLRRSVIDTFGGYQPSDHAVGEDYAFWSRLIQAGVKFANLPEPLLFYRIHEDQIKQSKLRETIQAVLSVRGQYWSSERSFRVRLQQWGERALLHLPQRFVSHLVLRQLWHYRVHASRSGAPILTPSGPATIGKR